MIKMHKSQIACGSAEEEQDVAMLKYMSMFFSLHFINTTYVIEDCLLIIINCNLFENFIHYLKKQPRNKFKTTEAFVLSNIII